MVINANYGLGETVVSGTAEPDMITLSSKQDGTFDIISKDVGAKKEKMEVLESGGTSTTSVSETSARQCSLPDDSVFKLANIAKLIERYFGDPRDIEWAVKDDVIYLLQARPITTFEMETEEDLLVEFDSPLAKDDEWVTNANIGEMMPGAVTPLTASIFSRTIESIMQILQQHFGILPGPGTWPIHKCMLLRYSHMFINMHTLGNISTERVSICNKEMGDLALFGRVIHDLTPAMLSQHNGTVNVFRRHLNTFKFIKSQIVGWNKLAELQDIARNYHFNNITDTSTASELYQEIHRKLPDYHLAFDDSITTSSLSGIWSQVVVAILSGGGKNWNTAHFSDMAVLLSDCKDVASAEVPLAMEAVTMAISKSGHTEAFLAMDAGSAAKWLMEDEDSADAGQQFQLFLRKHGHRCIRESEFREPSWGLDPSKVIPIIQTMLKHPYGSDKKTVTVEDAINQLKSPVTVIGKKILKWVVPRARGAVGNRELGKSLAIEVANHFKCAYWKLSEMMVKEGYLPDKDLLFFLTHKEIGKVLTGSPTLVAKAVRRRRAFPNLMDMNFPEISVGLPQTLEDDDEISPTSVQMTGMPVCHGVAKGVARVITNLDDAKNIQSGDILIVCYTDVGWTPYFPLIAGLVTELGGLLSHGAVVAREYGLPCIVNVRRATSVFKSGDYVVLNGVKGTIEKREKE
ncbi:rifampicin phosphotransferase-like [Glandiceps talaboti]